MAQKRTYKRAAGGNPGGVAARKEIGLARMWSRFMRREVKGWAMSQTPPRSQQVDELAALLGFPGHGLLSFVCWANCIPSTDAREFTSLEFARAIQLAKYGRNCFGHDWELAGADEPPEFDPPEF